MKIAVAKVHLKSTAEGGKKLPIGAGGDYSCPAFFPDVPELSKHGYDCRLLLRRAGRSIAPGETAQDVAVAFLSPNEVFPHLMIGTRFVLWEAGPIGEAVVTSLREGDG